MPISKNFSIAIMNPEKINEVNKIIVRYSVSSTQSSAHELFDMEYINFDEMINDVTFFKMLSENEADLDNKINDLIKELDQIDTEYTLRNEDTGELLVWIKSVGTLDIKFDRIKFIEKGSYEKIDELKNAKTEFGYCKGYTPLFRPVEGKPIGEVKIIPEQIYMFSKSREELLKLKDYLSEKIIEINPDFELELNIIK